MLIRPVEARDAQEWLRMRMLLWPDSTTEKELGEITLFLAQSPRVPLMYLYAAFVCERPEGGLYGLAEVALHLQAPGCTTDRIGYLEAWYVDLDVRQQGIGRALVAVAEDWARAQGCVEMASDTDASYPLSPSAHAALGYQTVEQYTFRKDLV